MIEVGRVEMINIDDIVVEDRARIELGNLDEFEANMRESGLISPLAVKDLKNGKYRLLAGGRRYIILKRNGNTVVPAKIYDKDLSLLEMKIIEKSENFYRKDMEYWEMDQLTLEINELNQQLHGKKIGSSSGWSAADTAKQLGISSKSTVTESIKRATLRRQYPEMFENCKTASDADKIIKKVHKMVETKIIAKQIEESRTDHTLIDITKRYIIDDFFKGVKDIPDETMDFIEIDPPYGIDLTNVKSSDGESQYIEGEYNEISNREYQKFLSMVFKECYRVLKNNSWLVCWFAPEPWFNEVYNNLISIGFNTTRMCGIWIKPTAQSLNPLIKLANSYEMFFYAWKGKPELNRPGTRNIFDTPPVPPQQKTHPTEKPVELMKEIYSVFVSTGSKILIPFLGSGNGIIAAYSLGMNAIGFEKSKSYKDSFILKVNNGIKYLR